MQINSRSEKGESESDDVQLEDFKVTVIIIINLTIILCVINNFVANNVFQIAPVYLSNHAYLPISLAFELFQMLV